MLRSLRSVLFPFVLLVLTCSITVSQDQRADSIRTQIRVLEGHRDHTLLTDSLLFNARNELANLLAQSQPDSAIRLLASVISQLEQEYPVELKSDPNLKRILATSCNQSGNILSSQGDYSGASAYYKKALALRLEGTDRKGAGNTFNNLGILNKNLGNYPDAIRNHLEALKIRESIGDSAGIAMSRNNIGSVYFVQNNFPEALKNYEVALEIRKNLSDKKGVAGTLNNIGNIYVRQEKFTEALRHYFLALQTAQEIGEKKLTAECFNNIGNCYYKQGYNEKARENFKAALSLQEVLGDKRGMITTCKNLGFTHLEENKYDDVLRYLDTAMDLARSIKARDQEMVLYFDYATLYSRMKKYDLAYKNLQFHSDLKDTLLSAEKNQQIAELQTRYETEKKDREIALLNKEKALKTEQLKSEQTMRKSILFGAIMAILLIVILVNRYRVLTEQRKKTEKAEFEKELHELQMKALRSQMNPHFIFNCLNSVQRYILKNEKTNAVEYLQKFASLMRLILDNSEKSMVTLHDEINMLELYMHLEALRFDQGMEIEMIVSPDIRDEEIQIPSMILQPYVENAILHGLMNKEERGKIKIDISRKENLLTCIIEDNGIGREKAAEYKSKRKALHQSKGLSITKARVDLLNQMHQSSNSIRVYDLKNSQGEATGTRVEVIIPVV